MMSALKGSKGFGLRTEATMVERRRTVRRVIAVACLAVIMASAVVVTRRGHHRMGSAPKVAIDARLPLSLIAKELEKGNAEALAALYQRVMPRSEGVERAPSDSEADEWLSTLTGLRIGFSKFSAYGRASALAVTARIFDKFAIEPTPARWIEALPPTHDLFCAGLGDPAALNVRVEALNDVSRLWLWSPGRDMMPVEEKVLAEWKEGFHAPVVSRLADPQPTLRAAAVACLAALPIASAAAPAAAYVADPDAVVRGQTLVSFASRRSILSDESILRCLSDSDMRVPPLAEQVLKARGLTPEQIGLGALIVHPKTELRESVIPMLATRTDIDPVVWLLQLSRDPEESVRLKAAEALAARNSPEARRRLTEMALSDTSAAVKKMAGNLAVPGSETASLPPLPGSPSLTPKAN